ncbi:MAG: glycoside hydrolase family 3 N-terminal domain-containing protein [Sandaracinaceae bacterium]
MARMSDRAAAGRVLVAGYPASEPPPSILRALADDDLAGVIMFKRNLAEGPSGAARQVRALAAVAARAPLVAIDQEGGRVQRLKAPVLESCRCARSGPRRRGADPIASRAGARPSVAAIGFNVDFAPVLDVDTNPDNPVIGDRSFGADPALVARHGWPSPAGSPTRGSSPAASTSRGTATPSTTATAAPPALAHDMARLEAVELVPLRAAVGEVGSVMTAHIVFRALDPGGPGDLVEEGGDGASCASASATTG